jgi:protein involved in polysaccharide export with SLBB domain
MELLKAFGNILRKWAWLPALIALAGCQDVDPYTPIPQGKTPASAAGTNNGIYSTAPAIPLDTTNYVLQVGDQLTVSFFDITPAITPITDEIKDDGTITLIYNEKFQAAGKSIGQLETMVHDRYVPAYVKYMTVNIAPANRSYTVQGEVRAPNRYGYSGHMTVLGAIATAGGFTDYANKRNVQVTRADHRQFRVNCVKALADPDLDVEIFPGDKIYVNQQWW